MIYQLSVKFPILTSMIRRIFIFLALVAATGCSTTETQENMTSGFFIGTYTSETSEGIYHADFDPQTGAFSDLQVSVRTENPSYLALSDDGSHVYAVNENVEGRNTGMITTYERNNPGQLEKVKELGSEGAYPCYVSLTADGNGLLVANYGGGNVLYAELTQGVTGQSRVYDHFGTGPDSSRQEAPHAHFIRQMPGTNYALAADLGADKVYQYALENGSMELLDSIAMEPGSGPRHIDFHPLLPVMYVINELNSTIAVFSYDKDSNVFTQIQVMSTLPDGYEGENYCADIHIHPNGQLLFGSNRGHDSIVSYRVEDNGMLEMTGHFSEGVAWPRNFALSPDNDFLIIANQQGNSVISASIDMNTGLLTGTGHSLEVSQPTCIAFE